MEKQVIHIFGASGSGTSTLGSLLAERLGWSFMDTDDYFWLPTDPKFSVKRPRQERLSMMKKDIECAGNVVLSGSLVDWGDELIPYFTLAVRLETDTDIRICRLKNREYQRFGNRIARGGDMYNAHVEFLQWAGMYDSGGLEMRSKAKHDAWQLLLLCKCLCLDGSAPVEELIALVLETLRT